MKEGKLSAGNLKGKGVDKSKIKEIQFLENLGAKPV